MVATELTHTAVSGHHQHTARDRASPVPFFWQAGGPTTLASDCNITMTYWAAVGDTRSIAVVRRGGGQADCSRARPKPLTSTTVQILEFWFRRSTCEETDEFDVRGGRQRRFGNPAIVTG